MRDKKKNYRESSVPIVFNKSNLIINAIGKPSGTSQKLLNMALSRLEVDPALTPDEEKYFKDLLPIAGADYSSGIVACFKQSDFRRLIPGNSSSWESTRNYLCSKEGLIKEFTMAMPSPKGSGIPSGVIALVVGAYFDDERDMIYVKFQDNAYMRDVLTQLKNTTKLKLNTMCKLRGGYSIRIFEMMESCIRLDIWERNKKGLPATNSHLITLGVERLKWTIGYTYILDNTPTAIAEVILGKIKKCMCDEDYDRIYDSYKEHLKGTTWYAFQRDVLIPTLKELNKVVPDRTYSYETDKAGGRKVKYIKFTVEESDKHPTSLEPATFEVVEADDRSVVINTVRTILDRHPFSKYFSDNNCYTLFTKAEQDYQRIEKAYDAFDQRVKAELRNGVNIDAMALMCTLIKNNAEENRVITYEDYLSTLTNIDDIDNIIETLKRIIIAANYQESRLSEQEHNLIASRKKYLGLDLGLSLDESSNASVSDLCLLLKKKDTTIKQSFTADTSGQVSMIFEN